MIWWVYQQVKKVDGLADVLVATDDEKIYETCQEFGMKVLMTSPEHATGTDRLGEVARQYESDFYINIQGDEPLIEPEVIRAIVEEKIRHPEAEVINTMTPVQEILDVHQTSIVKAAASKDGRLLYLSRAAIPCSKKNEPVAFRKHLGLYGLTREALMFFSETERGSLEQIEDVEMLRFLENGWPVQIVEVSSRSIGVDLPEDVKKVETVMKQLGWDQNEA